MKVESQAGKFILRFERMEPGDSALVITGKMGVWEATTTMGLAEMLSILKMTLQPRVLGYLIKALFTGGFRTRPEGEA